MSLPRSTLYYDPVPRNPYEDVLMRLIDERYTRYPFLGVERLVDYLRRSGHPVGPKRVRRLMREMGIAAIYPKPRLSQSHPQHRKYPYLLKDLVIRGPNHVWCTDITYIRMPRGFLYLVAIMDWFSRYVLSWSLSNTLETEFCLESLEQALSGNRPEIFNSDQGSQFTSEAFTSRLEQSEVRISMDGRGRFYDNIFIERLWRSVKYEEVYLKEYRDGWEAMESLSCYFRFYNEDRPHMGLDKRTPAEVYYG